MTNALVRVGLLMSLLVMVAACGPRTVTRMAPEQAMDLSGRWNDVDSRLVAQALISQSFESPYGANWAMRHAQVHGGEPPRVIVGTVRNRSMEHIPVGTFVRDLERAFVNSGVVRVVASRDEREEIRAERDDQQQNAAANTRAQVGMESGADYMLQGEIQTIEDREGRRSVMYYQVDVLLVNLQTNERTWVGQHKIKKYIERSRVRM